MNNDIFAILAGLVGVFLHCAMKGKSLLDDARVANIDFNMWHDYIVRDAITIVIAVATIPALWLLQAEIIGLYPKIEGIIRIMYFLVGLSGSYLVQSVASRAKKLIRKQIDDKTNALTDITGEGNTTMNTKTS